MSAAPETRTTLISISVHFQAERLLYSNFTPHGSIANTRTALIFGIAVIVFGALALWSHPAYLLHGLDGQYSRLTAIQSLAWSRYPFEPGWNPLQALGTIWYGFNASLFPSYRAARFFPSSEVYPVVLFMVTAAELFLATAFLAVTLGFSRPVAMGSGIILVLLTVPLLGTIHILFNLGTVPHVGTLIAVSTAIIALFIRLGTRGPFRDTGIFLALMVLAAWIPAATTVAIILVAPVISVFAVAKLLATKSRREFQIKVGTVVVVVAVAVIMELWEYFFGVYNFSAAYFFWDQFIPSPFYWSNVSIAFQFDYGVIGPLVFAAALLECFFGRPWEWGGAPWVRRACLATMVLIIASGTIVAFAGDRWKGPMIRYFEFAFLPIYAILCATFVARLLTALFHTIERQVTASDWLTVIIYGAFSALTVQKLAKRILMGGAMLVAIGLLVRDSGNPGTLPWPPSETPLVTLMRDEVALQPGTRFRGRVATISGYDPANKTIWGGQAGTDFLLTRQVGNDHRLVGLWYFDIPTLAEYSSIFSPALYAVARTFLAHPGDGMVRGILTFSRAKPRILRLLGVRFVIASSGLDTPFRERARLKWDNDRWLYLFELRGANIGDYAPTRSLQVSDFPQAMTLLADDGIDFRQTVIAFQELPEPLVRPTDSELRVDRGGLKLRAQSTATSVLVLPFEYSHCLSVEGTGADRVRLFRANAVTLGVLFTGNVDVSISFLYGPFRNADCRYRDVEELRRLGLSRAHSGISGLRRGMPS